ncbi:MAG: xylose isomerase, partial [Cyanobacteria bacterium P01_C01_bin.118]
MRLKNGLHLTYCSNIHPGETWPEVKQNLETFLPALKQKLSPDHAFGVGLRLSNLASQELLTDNNLSQFKTWLADNNLYVFTLNGFPYGGFHHKIVKDQVYAPDWSKSERLDYTLRLVDILAALLPESIDGGISTVPLSYKPWWSDDDSRDTVFANCTLHLAQLTAKLAAL